MKKQLHIILAAGLALAAGNAKGQTLIHYWSFNNYDTSITLPDVAHIPAAYSTINPANAIVSYQTQPGTSAAYITYLDTLAGDVLNARMGEGAGHAIRTRNPSDSMELLFSFPTTHYQNIVLKYETERSNNGPQSQRFDYSTDGGTNWSTNGITVNGTAIDTYVTNTTWSLITININNAAVNNNSNLTFRVRFNINDTGTSGNNRFDNLTVEGDTLTGASVNQVNATGFSLYPNPAGNELNITTAVTGTKNITIYNIAGQVVSTAVQTGNNIRLDVSQLQPGVYFTGIVTENGEQKKLKFIKE